MFWENYVRLCSDKNISPSAAGAAIGVTYAAVSKWKKGAIPNGSTLQKIADYFGVSVASLLGEDEPDLREKAETNRETILRITESAEENLMHLFMLKLFELPEDQRDTLRNLFKLPADEFRRAMDMLNIMWRK
jgi:transcriptional regulator with XRE-family HTH domain